MYRALVRMHLSGTIQYGGSRLAERTIVPFGEQNLDLSMLLFNRKVKRLINKLPGKKLGEYRLLPLCFLLGAALEYSMIHWQVGEVNFYKTYKRRRVEELVEKRLKQEQA